MPIPSTGPVSLLDVQNEFDGSNPIGINEYYQGAASGYVTSSNYTPAGQIPTSGPISLQDFRGVSKNVAFIFNDTITASTVDGYSLAARAATPFAGSNGATGWDGVVPLIATVTINAGVTVTGPSGASAAFSTLRLDPYPAGSSLTLINNGTIAGLGGAGGAGGSANASGVTAGGAGGAGNPGLYIYSIPTDVYNNGTIGGGGGGGGGGGAARATASNKTTTQTWAHGGGGGGGGRSSRAGGAGGPATGVDWPGPGSAGGTATYTAVGAGGAIWPQATMISGGTIRGGVGGAGGTLGASGAAGQAGALSGLYDAGSTSAGGAGGPPGAAVLGGINIAWYAYGTRLGTIDHPGTNMLPGGVTGPTSFSASSFYVGFTGHTVFAEITFQPNGNVMRIEGDTTAIAPIQDAGDWYSPNLTNVGTGYSIRVTRTSGSGVSYVGNTLGTWQPLSSSFEIRHERDSGGFFNETATYSVQISNNGGASTLVTHTVTIWINTEV